MEEKRSKSATKTKKEAGKSSTKCLLGQGGGQPKTTTKEQVLCKKCKRVKTPKSQRKREEGEPGPVGCSGVRG